MVEIMVNFKCYIKISIIFFIGICIFSVLYKSSPIYYHSSYVVVISANGQNSELLPSWPSWYGCGRAIEAASKDLLICTVLGPEYEEEMLIDLSQYTINDIIVRRWVPSQNRKKP